MPSGRVIWIASVSSIRPCLDLEQKSNRECGCSQERGQPQWRGQAPSGSGTWMTADRKIWRSVFAPAKLATHFASTDCGSLNAIDDQMLKRNWPMRTSIGLIFSLGVGWLWRASRRRCQLAADGHPVASLALVGRLWRATALLPARRTLG